jgi:hypothetical protein
MVLGLSTGFSCTPVHPGCPPGFLEEDFFFFFLFGSVEGGLLEFLLFHLRRPTITCTTRSKILKIDLKAGEIFFSFFSKALAVLIVSLIGIFSIFMKR